MKKLSLTTLTLLIFIAGTVLFTSCGNNKKAEGQEQTEQDADDTDGKDADKNMAYVCPMHPEVTGTEGDTCSKCNMKLEAVKSTDTTKVHTDH